MISAKKEVATIHYQFLCISTKSPRSEWLGRTKTITKTGGSIHWIQLMKPKMFSRLPMKKETQNPQLMTLWLINADCSALTMATSEKRIPEDLDCFLAPHSTDMLLVELDDKLSHSVLCISLNSLESVLFSLKTLALNSYHNKLDAYFSTEGGCQGKKIKNCEIHATPKVM